LLRPSKTHALVVQQKVARMDIWESDAVNVNLDGTYLCPVSVKNAALEHQEDMRRPGIGNQEHIIRLEAWACAVREQPAEKPAPTK